MRFDFQAGQSWPAGIAAVFRRLQGVLQGYHREGGGVRLERLYLDLEVLDADPPSPAAGRARLYAVLDGGKVEVRALLPTGAAQTIATEP